jgi:hypothetical protein
VAKELSWRVILLIFFQLCLDVVNLNIWLIKSFGYRTLEAGPKVPTDESHPLIDSATGLAKECLSMIDLEFI